MQTLNTYPISVAPMLNWTTRHCRYFYRLISPSIKLYSEMITTNAILNGDKNRLLGFNYKESPLILQLGGSEVKKMAECAKIAQDFGYDGVNINVGCPSNRVQHGFFGACLMKTPEIVAQCVSDMSSVVNIPISVKSRIGINDNYSYSQLYNFIKIIASSGCSEFIIHARNAWLSGLNPKQNRNIPALDYDKVYKIKSDFNKLNIIINGGIKTIKDINKHLQYTNGVMLGREVYNNPYLLSEIEAEFDNNFVQKSRLEVLAELLEYINIEKQKGVPIRAITRHILGLYYAQKHSKKFKQGLSGKIIELQNYLDNMQQYQYLKTTCS